MSSGDDSKVVSLMPWDIKVRSATQKRDPRDLLTRDDADGVIRSLSPLEVYFAIKSLGVDDSGPFLAVVEPDQIRALFDLDVWRKNHLDVDDALVWLEGFKEVGVERVQQAAQALDPELMALLLKRRLLIAVKPADEDDDPLPDWVMNPPDEIQPVIETPDSRFFVAARPVDAWDELNDEVSAKLDSDERKNLLELVDKLYRTTDHEWIVHTLMSAAADFMSNLEEDALRFRNARLEDLGFPSRHRAIEVYAPLEPQTLGAEAVAVRLKAEIGGLPARFASSISRGLFSEAMSRVASPELVVAVEGELLALANAVLVADDVEPGDFDGLEDTLRRMRAYVEIALALGAPSGGEIEQAVTRLNSRSIRELFRVGYTLTLKLGTRARALASSGVFGEDPFSVLEESDRALLRALTRRRPRVPLALQNPDQPFGTRPFETIEDLELVDQRLRSLEALAVLERRLNLRDQAARFGEDVEPPLEEQTLDLLLSTAVMNVVLDQKPLAALKKSDLARLAEHVSDDAFEALLQSALAKLVGGDADEALVQRAASQLSALTEALAQVSPSDVDPRFIGGVLRKV